MTNIFFRTKLNHLGVDLSKSSSEPAQKPASRMGSGTVSPCLSSAIFEVLSLVKTVARCYEKMPITRTKKTVTAN